jgi:hypothetical protein
MVTNIVLVIPTFAVLLIITAYLMDLVGVAVLIELEAGTHTISLGPPANFTPKTRRVVLKGTSEPEPKEVAFYDA